MISNSRPLFNAVGDVGDVGDKKTATHDSYMPRHSWLSAFLSGMSGMNSHGCARVHENASLLNIYKLARTWMYPRHPRHPRQAAYFVAYTCRGCIYASPTPTTTTNYLFKKKKMICTKENTAEFRANLRASAPEFYSLAKNLFDNGFIDGLRGISLEIGPFQDDPVVEIAVKQENGAVCMNCGNFIRDKIGDGYGIGNCLLNVKTAQVKWAGTEACNQYENNFVGKEKS